MMKKNVEKPKVTIIIPVYNTERFLKNCLSSISNQSYKNIEIIIVNDGSTDESVEIILGFIKKEQRAVYISQKNQGVSAARNVGLNKATGEYILFCDSDDYNPPGAVEALVGLALQDDADVVVGNYYKKDRLGEKLVKVIKTNTAKELIESFIVGANHAGLWNKLYSRKNLSGVFFNKEVSIREDMLFNVEVFLKAPKISFVNEPVYIYVQRKGSALKTVDKKRFSESSAVTLTLETMLRGKVSEESISKMLALDAYANIASFRHSMSSEQYDSNIKALNKIDWGLKKRIIIAMADNDLIDLSKVYKAVRRIKQNILMY